MEKLTYIAPEVEVLEIQIEQGFAQTGNTEDPIWGGEGQWII